METIIIIGPPAVGKTHLANLLTYNGQTGAILDFSGGEPYFDAAYIRSLLLCPRVVITGEFVGSILGNPKMKEFFKFRQPPIVLEVRRGDDTPLIPQAVRTSPAKFRTWLFSQGNYVWSGSAKQLKLIFAELPHNPTLKNFFAADRRRQLLDTKP